MVNSFCLDGWGLLNTHDRCGDEDNERRQISGAAAFILLLAFWRLHGHTQRQRYSGLNVQRTTRPCIFPHTLLQLYLFKSTKPPPDCKGPYTL